MLSLNSWVRLRSIAVVGWPASSGTAGPSVSHANLLSRLLERIRPSGTSDDDWEHLEDPIAAQMTALKPSSEGYVESMVDCQPKEQRLTSPALHKSAYREAQRCSFLLSRHISQAACSSDVNRRQLHTSCAAHPQQISVPSVGRALFGISTQPQSLCLCSDRPGERRGIPCQLLSRRLPHTDPNTAKRVSEANSILQTLDIIRFREHLARESEQKLRTSYPELLQMCKDSGAAQSDAEAERICEALRAAGIVLKVGDLVYLRPQEVTAMVMRALPDTEAEVLGRLRELEAELAPLAAQKHKIDTRARRRTNGVLWAGLALLLVQWGLFLRLTFWELSWDVMEPISYFFSSLWGIVAYCYFLVTKEDFAFRHSYSKMNQTFQVGGERDHGFDRARYEQVLQDIRRYRGYLRSATDKPGLDADENASETEAQPEEVTQAWKGELAR